MGGQTYPLTVHEHFCIFLVPGWWKALGVPRSMWISRKIINLLLIVSVLVGEHITIPMFARTVRVLLRASLTNQCDILTEGHVNANGRSNNTPLNNDGSGDQPMPDDPLRDLDLELLEDADLEDSYCYYDDSRGLTVVEASSLIAPCPHLASTTYFCKCTRLQI